VREGLRVCCERVLQRNPPFAPSGSAVTRHVGLDPAPPSVGVARSFVLEALQDFDTDCRDVAVLLTSELVTNAILHARTPVELGVVRDGDKLLVCVADRMDDNPVLVPQDKSRDRPGGRGLALVADLAQRWGTETYTGGKTVWFALAASRREVGAR
jgi:anti-sigma regulatory factor (Ser/Thr protein kinase)